MKAHEKGPVVLYKKYREDEVSVGQVLDIYDEAKAFMVNKASDKYGKDVSEWPRDVQQEMRTTFSAWDMLRDIMMALYKDDKEKTEAAQDEHSPMNGE